MDVFFTTVVRQAPVDEGGELVHLDWSSKKVVERIPLVPVNPSVDDPNPRGNARGGRGIVRIGDLIYVATYHSLNLFDVSLKPKGRISHGLFVGLHELCDSGDTLWLASTAIDAAVGIDYKGNLIDSWWARENPKLKQRLLLEPLPIDRNADNRLLWLQGKKMKGPSHTHLNAVAFRDGDLYCLLNSFGLVYNTVTDRIVVEDSSIIGCHNLVFIGNRMVINNSRGKCIMVYTLDGQLTREIKLLGYPEICAIHESVINVSPTKRVLFIRGLSPIDQSRILVGFSPATIVEIDLETGRLLDLFQYSQDVAVCVHGLLACNDC